MRSKEIEEYKKGLTLKNIQRSILVGTLLGDGHLETQNNGRTYRLKIEHALFQQEYVEWLHEQFKDWVRGGMYRKIKNGKEYIGFTTYSHAAFRFYAQQFYQEKNKHVPRLIGKMIDPLALAVWFLDDGSWKSNKHRTFIIHSVGFTKNDLLRLQDILKKKFGIEVNLHVQKEKYWRMYIKTASAETFRKIVQPYIKKIPSMKYKLGNKNA